MRRFVLFIVFFGVALIMSEKLKEYFMVAMIISLIQPKEAAHHMLVQIKNEGKDTFPTNFSFGSASSSFQVEGAWNEDGKGPSIWDTFVHTYPERVADHLTPDIGPNSYHYYKDDVKALQQVGVNKQIDVTICKSHIVIVYIHVYSSFNIIVSLYHGREYFRMGRRLIQKLLIITVD